MMSQMRERMREMLEKLERERDELKVRVHLGKAEAREEWDKMEGRIAELRSGLDKAGVKIIGPGDVTDDDLLNGMGDPVIGTVTAHLYSADHQSPTNKAFVEAFKKANKFRPNFMAVGGYGLYVEWFEGSTQGGNWLLPLFIILGSPLAGVMGGAACGTLTVLAGPLVHLAARRGQPRETTHES